MRQLLYLFTICFLILATSCGDDQEFLPEPEVADVNLNFKAMFGEGPLDFNSTTYDYNGRGMTISKFNFFISNVSLFKNVDGVVEQTELFEIDFVDLTENNNSVTIETAGVPIGNYDGVIFSIGVPSDLNNQTPADFSITHPLGSPTITGSYWSAWNSFIFTKVEGRLDTSGSQDLLNFSYHIGTDEMFRNNVEKNTAVDLVVGVPMTINFEIDLQKIFLNSGGLDIETYPSSHNPDEPTAANHVMGNFPNAISVD